MYNSLNITTPFLLFTSLLFCWKQEEGNYCTCMWQKIFTYPKWEALDRAFFFFFFFFFFSPKRHYFFTFKYGTYNLLWTSTIPEHPYIYGYTLTTLKMEISLANNNHLLLDKVMQVKMSAHEIFIHNILYFLFRTASYMGVVLSIFPSCLFNIRKLESN